MPGGAWRSVGHFGKSVKREQCRGGAPGEQSRKAGRPLEGARAQACRQAAVPRRGRLSF